MNQIAERQSATHPRERVERGLRDAAREVSRVDGRLRLAVREKPLAMAFAALGVGFVLGRVLARR